MRSWYAPARRALAVSGHVPAAQPGAPCLKCPLTFLISGMDRPMQLSPSIFKAYDIRGIVPSTLDEEVAEALGRAFGAAAQAEGEKVVAVGRDGRLSGPALAS